MPSCAIIQKIGQEINQQTMSKINYDLTLIKGIVFDVDGVLFELPSVNLVLLRSRELLWGVG